MRAAAAIAAVTCAACGRIAFDTRDDAGATGDVVAGVQCGTEASLVACYGFEASASDSSGHGNDATGNPVFVNGRIGQGVMLGVGSSLVVADSPSLDVAHVTVMAWVRLDALPPVDERTVVVDHNQGFALFVSKSGIAGFGVSTSASGGANDMVAFPLGTFTHIAASYDGSVPRLYVNGLQVAMGGASGDITSADTTGTRIGGNLPDTMSGAEQVWRGVIDEVGIWNEALSPARIAAAANE